MENARVGIIEDNELVRGMLSRFVVEMGLHEIVFTAQTMNEALAAIESLQPGDVDVALVDGNLSPNRDDSSEGAQISELLRAKLGETVTIIGISGSGPVEGADINIPKTGTSVGMDVVQAISRI